MKLANAVLSFFVVCSPLYANDNLKDLNNIDICSVCTFQLTKQQLAELDIDWKVVGTLESHNSQPTKIGVAEVDRNLATRIDWIGTIIAESQHASIVGLVSKNKFLLNRSTDPSKDETTHHIIEVWPLPIIEPSRHRISFRLTKNESGKLSTEDARPLAPRVTNGAGVTANVDVKNGSCFAVLASSDSPTITLVRISHQETKTSYKTFLQERSFGTKERYHVPVKSPNP